MEKTGITKMPGMPNLVGLDPKYFVAAVNAYKSGQRKHDMMKTLVSALERCRHEQHRALLCAAEAGARLKRRRRVTRPRAKPLPRPAPAATAKAASARMPATPSLAGQDAQYFAAAMRAYKDGSRSRPGHEGACGIG